MEKCPDSQNTVLVLYFWDHKYTSDYSLEYYNKTDTINVMPNSYNKHYDRYN